MKKYHLLVFLFLISATLTTHQNCERSYSRLGRLFCIECATGFKLNQKQYCEPCSENDSSWQCHGNIFFTTSSYSAEKSNYFSRYAYPEFYQKDSEDSSSLTDSDSYDRFFKKLSSDIEKQMSEFQQAYYRELAEYKIDPYCKLRNKDGRCLQCLNKYSLDLQTSICKLNRIQPSKLQNEGCLIFSENLNKCIKCKNPEDTVIKNYSCDHFQIKDRNQLTNIFAADHNNIQKKQKTDLSQNQDTIIPLLPKTNSVKKIVIDQQLQKDIFLVDQKYLMTSKPQKKINLAANVIIQRQPCQKRHPIHKERCIVCKSGFILNRIEGGKCQKIKKSLILETQNNQPQTIKKQPAIKKNLVKVNLYKDNNCQILNSDYKSEVLCLKCSKRMYFSRIKEKCIEIDRNCLRYKRSSGQCYMCKYGYIPKQKECLLINRNNYSEQIGKMLEGKRYIGQIDD